MSYMLSEITEMKESILDKLYYEQISSKEKLEIEEHLDCLINQSKSKIEGWLTDIEKNDKLRIVLGTGIFAKIDNEGVEQRKIPYAAVFYKPKLLLKDSVKFMKSIESLDSYLSQKSRNIQAITIPVPLRILEEMKLANVIKKQARWMVQKTSYIISDDNVLTTSLAEDGFGIQSYFTRKNRKDGFGILIDAAKEFERKL